MFVFLAILILLTALSLILIVVVQNSKGGGLAAGFDSSNKYMGVRKTTDFLEKATWWLAGALLVLSVGSSYFMHASQVSDTQKLHQEVQNNQPKAQPGLPIATDQLPSLGMTQEGAQASQEVAE